MSFSSIRLGALLGLVVTSGGYSLAAEETVSTIVSARTGNGYKRERLKDGSFKPEYYALANSGRIAGTTADNTVDHVTYPQVAEIASKMLAGQKYLYAQKAEQAKLLLMLQWGNTIAINREHYEGDVGSASQALEELRWLIREMNPDRSKIENMNGADPMAKSEGAVISDARGRVESALLQLMMDNRVRDRVNEHNAKVLGFTDDLADSNDIRRWAGGGDRFNDLMADLEEVRYYIVVTAYDFEQLTKHNKKKVLWVTKVSVSSTGNRFYDSYAAMLKGASKYFGQVTPKIVRGEESKGAVEMGDLKFLGEAKDAKKPAALPAKVEDRGK